MLALTQTCLHIFFFFNFILSVDFKREIVCVFCVGDGVGDREVISVFSNTGSPQIRRILAVHETLLS